MVAGWISSSTPGFWMSLISFHFSRTQRQSVGKLAISQYLPVNKLVDVIGKKIQQNIDGLDVELIPLPHPSGAATWHRRSPGKELLAQALELLAQHESWEKVKQ